MTLPICGPRWFVWPPEVCYFANPSLEFLLWTFTFWSWIGHCAPSSWILEILFQIIDWYFIYLFWKKLANPSEALKYANLHNSLYFFFSVYILCIHLQSLLLYHKAFHTPWPLKWVIIKWIHSWTLGYSGGIFLYNLFFKEQISQIYPGRYNTFIWAGNKYFKEKKKVQINY